MKANRKFVTEEEAVSPVIAVILMVAITVVLAATVFVLVSDIGGQQNVAPSFNLAKDESADRLTVQSGAENANWNRLQISFSSGDAIADVANVYCVIGADATTAADPCDAPDADGAGTYSSDFVEIVGATDPMNAGDFLDVCTGPTTGPGATDLVVTIRDVDANQQMGTWTFQSVAACGS